LHDQNEQIHAAERLLFEQNDPQAALAILSTLLGEDTQLVEWPGSGGLPHVRPYLQYLLGLAYEMSGDERNAAQVYWELWNSYPLHPLSYVVQQKLALRAP
jgi:hypothetical protein